jgi:hypothetical protein
MMATSRPTRLINEEVSANADRLIGSLIRAADNTETPLTRDDIECCLAFYCSEWWLRVDHGLFARVERYDETRRFHKWPWF